MNQTRVAYDPLANDPMGGSTHLMQYLVDKYKEYLAGVIEERKLTISIDDAMKRATAIGFAQWCTEHLNTTRVVETFYAAGNIGISLTDGEKLVLCPPTTEEVRGTMQESHAVGITEGLQQPGKNLPSAGTTLRI